MSPAGHLFEVAPHGHVRELHDADIPALQAFFDANPEYSQRVNGRPPQPDEAHSEFHDRPPAGMSYRQVWVLGYFSPQHELLAMASVLADLFAPGVWHVGLFIVATRLHGQGQGRAMYQALEQWCRQQGAVWMRLGVVVGNAQAQAFWRRVGFEPLRLRHGVDTGGRVNDIEVMFKPLAARGRDDYLSLVARDRPDPT